MKGSFEKRSFRYDVILIAILLFISVCACLFVFFNQKSGEAVSVEVDGAVVGVYPLSRDGEFSLADGSNILVIEDGRAFMKSADCPDKTCVRSRAVSKVGESIVCLPNRVSVSVVGDGGVDIVS